MELHWRERGAGPALLCLHETAASAAIWEPLGDAIGGGARVIALDRRGWGESGAPELYAATTVEEQAADASALLEAIEVPATIVCGAGLGAVVALELLSRRPDLVGAGVLIEPPLLAYVAEATEGLSTDREAIAEAVRSGGPQAAVELYLTGALAHLGAGAERIPDDIGAVARRGPRSLFAELGTVPRWSLRSAELLAVDVPSRIVMSASTPPLLCSICEQLAPRLGASELVELGGEGLPHVGGAPQLADVIRGLI